MWEAQATLCCAAAGLAYEHAHGIVLLHDEGLCAIDLDLGADHFFLEVHRSDLAILAARARTQSNDVGLLRLVGDSVRDDGASGGVGFAVDAAQSHGARRCSIRRFHWPVRASLTDRTRVIDGIEQDAGEDIHVLTDCRDNEWPARPCH